MMIRFSDKWCVKRRWKENIFQVSIKHNFFLIRPNQLIMSKLNWYWSIFLSSYSSFHNDSFDLIGINSSPEISNETNVRKKKWLLSVPMWCWIFYESPTRKTGKKKKKKKNFHCWSKVWIGCFCAWFSFKWLLLFL